MKARYAGKCKSCSKPILVGQDITWNRAIRGSTKHVDCVYIETADSTARAVWDAETSAPETSGIATRELIKSVEAISAVEAAIAGAPVLTDGDGTATHTLSASGDAIPVVKRARKSKAETGTLASLSQTASWFDVLKAVLSVVNRVLLVGPPATGKSTTAMLVSGCKYRITMTETTSREDLIGMFHLIDGETKWIDGPVTAAMREGSAVLVDEIDRYSPEAASLLYALIDDKPHLALPNGEMLYATAGYKMIMTSNEGLDTLPVAVQDRIEVILNASTPHEDAIAELPEAMRNLTLCYYRSLSQPTIKLPTTVRRMKTLHLLLSNGMTPRLAANLVFGAGAEVLSILASAEQAKY